MQSTAETGRIDHQPGILDLGCETDAEFVGRQAERIEAAEDDNPQAMHENLANASQIAVLESSYQATLGKVFVANDSRQQPPPPFQERRLSAEIMSLIEEAFPSPSFAADFNFSNSNCRDDGPLLYVDVDLTPQYTPRAEAAETDNAVSIPILFKRVSMSAPFPDYAFEKWSDLMLVSLDTSFEDFLGSIHASTREHILAQRPVGRRILPSESMIHRVIVALKQPKLGGRSSKKAKETKFAVRAGNWEAVKASITQGQVEVKIKFWTEVPGSVAEKTRQERVRSGAWSTVELRA